MKVKTLRMFGNHGNKSQDSTSEMAINENTPSCIFAILVFGIESQKALLTYST